MKIKSVILSFIFFSTVNFVNGQNASILGKVLDIQTSPIEFANILLKKIDDGFTQGSITDFDGNFVIDISRKGDYEIRVSFVGYKDWKKNITVDQRMDLGNIILENNTNELDEVVVTSTAKVIERKEDKLIFNVAASPLKSGFDGMEVLQRAPNVLVNENGGIQMRNEAATILINGRISNLRGAIIYKISDQRTLKI